MCNSTPRHGMAQQCDAAAQHVGSCHMPDMALPGSQPRLGCAMHTLPGSCHAATALLDCNPQPAALNGRPSSCHAWQHVAAAAHHSAEGQLLAALHHLGHTADLHHTLLELVLLLRATNEWQVGNEAAGSGSGRAAPPPRLPPRPAATSGPLTGPLSAPPPPQHPRPLQRRRAPPLLPAGRAPPRAAAPAAGPARRP